MLNKIFKLSAHNTSARTEITAGITTFLTMAYILFVNPNILGIAGMDKGAVFVATCLAAAIGCFIMGLWANLPIALAPGMGLNAFFTFGVVKGMGYSWESALAAVFVSGLIFLILSALKVRSWLINAIPTTLKKAIAAGVGSFLAIIAFKSSGIIVASPATLVELGDITQFGPAMAILGFFLIIFFAHKKIPGGVIISILLVSVISVLAGKTGYSGIVSMPPSLAPTFLKMDFSHIFEVGMLSVIFAFLFVDLFDTAGTLIAVGEKAKLTDKNGDLPNFGKGLYADSTATVIGAALGTSNTTSFVESGAGVAAGGRTGLTAVVVGVMFLLSLFFAPLAGMIPAYATAGAIFYVSILMLFTLKNVDWNDMTEAAPTAVVLLMTPLTFSIANGITLGFITYLLVRVLSGQGKSVNVSTWVISLLLLAKIIFA